MDMVKNLNVKTQTTTPLAMQEDEAIATIKARLQAPGYLE